MNPGQPDLSPEGGGAGAAQATPTDYLEVVHAALAGLGRSTPEARRDVYARVREVVHRHLGLSGMAKPLADLERLELDLAIRNVEQQIRARESAAPVAGEVRAPRPPSRIADVGSVGPAIPRDALPRPASPLRLAQHPMVRRLLSPIGLAVALPAVGALVFAVYLVGSDISFWSADRSEPAGTTGETAAGAASQPQSAVLQPRSADAASDRPTRVRPVRADFVAKP
jgi:hypothetical protein